MSGNGALRQPYGKTQSPGRRDMPTRRDFQRLVEWCDRDAPFPWLKRVVGVALAVHSVVPSGTPHPPATALWTGDLALRGAAGISELPEEPVRFGGTLVGVRNPARQPQLSIRADVHQAVATLSGDHIPAAWTSGFEIEHVRDEGGLLQADWTFGDLGVGSAPPEGFDAPQVFELLLWPALRKAVDLGPP
jgi:hypothetical protein